MTIDWRLYEMLSPKSDCSPGNEPSVVHKIIVEHDGKRVVIPVPPRADVDVQRICPF